MLRKSWAAVVFIGLTASLLAISLIWPTHGHLLNTDEVNYVRAARLGLLANALETGSLTPLEFARFGLAKWRRAEPILPAQYDEAADPFLLRHFHPPFAVYLLSLVSSADNERVLRSIQLTGVLALIFAVVTSYRRISDRATWIGTVVVALLAIWVSRLGFESLSFHGWAAVWLTTSAALVTRTLNVRPARKDLILLGCSLALALLTLETGLFIWIGTAFCLLVWPRASHLTHKERGSQLLWIFITALVMVILVWPGTVLKASILKTFAMHVYRLRLGAEYANVGAVLQDVVMTLLPLLTLGPLAIGCLFVRHRATSKLWGPFVVLAGIYAAAMGRFVLRPDYLVPALAAFIPLIGLVIDRTPAVKGLRLVVGGGAAALIFISVPRSAGPTDDEHRSDLLWLRQELAGRESYVEAWHTVAHYLGPSYAVKTIAATPEMLALREGGVYRALKPADLLEKVVIFPKQNSNFKSAVAQELMGDCKKTERFHYIVYDCAKHPG